MLNFLYSTAVLAADDINLNPTGEFAALGDLTVGGIVSAFIRLILVIAALVFFFILVIGGIRWIASGGDKAQTETARNQITAALVGLVIVFAAWAIVQLINTFFGVDIFSLTLPTAQ
ncbi:hypothetical protein DRH13_02670 [Candidatus Woesebacteria bacterium]|nr:MAG: hypothetical protein DRH13_02670 [Candidatus Woesebacteria bacterium]